ncbi:MAG: YfhO family protein [Candidatus Coatesbacteria bacterium]|nr:YfhO family protein [Candidatus Coatesbacteria bacterium]
MVKKKKILSKDNLNQIKDFSDPLSSIEDWKIAAIIIIFMLILMLVFFRSFIFDKDAMLYGTDVQSQAYQSRLFAKNGLLHNGEIPRWNPYIYSGLPFIEILPYDVYYPFSLLYYFMPMHRAIGWRWLIHIPLAALFMFLFLRVMGRSKFSSIFGAIAFSLTGTILGYLFGGHDGRAYVVVWTPLVFYFAKKALDNRKLKYFIGMGVSIAMQIVTPHIQMMYFSCLALSAFILHNLIGRIIRKEMDKKDFANYIMLFILAVIIAASLGMAQLLPTTTFLKFSDRAEGETGYDFASSWAMPPQEAISLIIPDFSGLVFNYWGTNQFRLHTEYAGIVVLFLALISIILKRDSENWFWSILAAVGLLFCMGASTPVHKLIYNIVPMIGKFRGPSMMMFIVSMSFVILSTKTLDMLFVERKQQNEKTFKYAVITVLGIFVLFWLLSETSRDFMLSIWQSTLYGDKLGSANKARMIQNYPNYLDGYRYVGIILIASFYLILHVFKKLLRETLSPRTYILCLSSIVLLTVFDLFRVDNYFLLAPNKQKTGYTEKVVNISEYYKPDSGIKFMTMDNSFYRVFPLPQPLRGIYGPNDLMLYSIRTINGSQNFRLLWYKELVDLEPSFLRDVAIGKIPPKINPNIWKILGVKYLTTRQPLNEVWGLSREEQQSNRMNITNKMIIGNPQNLRLVYANQREYIYIYQFTDAFQHYFCTNIAKPSTREEALNELVKASTNPSDVSFVEDYQEEKKSKNLSDIKLLSCYETPGKFSLEIFTRSDVFLIQSEIWHPYWKAYIDGKETKIYRTDAFLRGLDIPSGKHKIDILYKSTQVEISQIISFLALIIVTVSLVILYLVERKNLKGKNDSYSSTNI